MSNTANATILFEGSYAQLEKVKKLIVGQGRFKEPVIDYSYVRPMLPGISDKNMYELFGCDWNSYILDRYNSEEKQKFDKKVCSFIKNEGWIGYKDTYINESSREVSVKYKNDALVVEAEFSWYCPNKFFVKIAEDFGLNIKILNFVEGNDTSIGYLNDKGIFTEIKNSQASILENNDFINYSIELGLHTPSDVLVLALTVGDDKLAQKIYKDYSISDISSSIDKMHAYLEEDYHDPSSTFIELEKNVEKDELITQFKNLQANKLKNIL